LKSRNVTVERQTQTVELRYLRIKNHSIHNLIEYVLLVSIRDEQSKSICWESCNCYRCNFGIGKATSIRLANLGAKVVIAINEADGRSVEDIITKAGNTASSFGADLTKEDSIKRMVDFTLEKYGKLDMACNNAGIELLVPTVDITRENYDKVMNINVWAVLNCMKYQLPAMLKKHCQHSFHRWINWLSRALCVCR
jgi:hypothetical protein